MQSKYKYVYWKRDRHLWEVRIDGTSLGLHKLEDTAAEQAEL